MPHDYENIIQKVARLNPTAIIAYLDDTLPELWSVDYLAMPGSTQNLVTVTFGDEGRAGHFCRYLFDHASNQYHIENKKDRPKFSAEDRVAAVWGTSRRERADTRDKARMKGFLKARWRDRGDDRGHFFAHTMGGGLDINLFPQAARVNRGSVWRQMEQYCSKNPGTFCFIRPFYTDESWRPARLEYGVVKMGQDRAPQFWGYVFEN
jgi:DNA/RNA non-specific endonuclease